MPPVLGYTQPQQMEPGLLLDVLKTADSCHSSVEGVEAAHH